jgi:hypothetical protein
MSSPAWAAPIKTTAPTAHFCEALLALKTTQPNYKAAEALGFKTNQTLTSEIRTRIEQHIKKLSAFELHYELIELERRNGFHFETEDTLLELADTSILNPFEINKITGVRHDARVTRMRFRKQNGAVAFVVSSDVRAQHYIGFPQGMRLFKIAYTVKGKPCVLVNEDDDGQHIFLFETDEQAKTFLTKARERLTEICLKAYSFDETGMFFNRVIVDNSGRFFRSKEKEMELRRAYHQLRIENGLDAETAPYLPPGVYFLPPLPDTPADSVRLHIINRDVAAMNMTPPKIIGLLTTRADIDIVVKKRVRTIKSPMIIPTHQTTRIEPFRYTLEVSPKG